MGNSLRSTTQHSAGTGPESGPGTAREDRGRADEASALRWHEAAEETCAVIGRGAASAVGAERGALSLYDPETKDVIGRSCGAAGNGCPPWRFPLASSRASARVVRTGKPWWSKQPGDDPLFGSPGPEGILSALVVPVIGEGEVLGLLHALNRPGGFAADDARTLAALAGAAAVALQNIRLCARERERRILGESLWEASRILAGGHGDDAALAAVLDQMRQAVPSQAALAAVMETGRLRVTASPGGDLDPQGLPELAALFSVALEGRQTLALSDTALLSRLGIRGSTSWAVTSPVIVGGEAVGAFVAVFDTEHAPRPRDLELVGRFADNAALFLEAGGRLNAERQARAHQAAIARITHLTATCHEPESLLQAVAPEIRLLSGADRVFLCLRKTRDPVLAGVADAGVASDEERCVRDFRIDLRWEPLAPLVERRRLFVLHGDGLPPALSPFPGSRCLMLVPLSSRDEILGIAGLVWMDRQPAFDPGLVDSLEKVAEEVALGVENARLFVALSQMASTDELTQLANRRRFTEAFRLELARARRIGTPLSLILADVDQLKRINDTHGHPVGDAAIRHVAVALARGRREIDIVARLGGEEFGLLLPDSDGRGAKTVAQRILDDLGGSLLPPVGAVTISMGIAIFSEDGGGEEELVRRADERLYLAKSGGRNRVCSASPSGAGS